MDYISVENEASSKHSPADPWSSFPAGTCKTSSNDAIQKDPVTTLHDIDNDEFFSQLKTSVKPSTPVEEEKKLASPLLKLYPAEKKAADSAPNDPWSSKAIATSQYDAKTKTTPDSLLNDLWLAPSTATKQPTNNVDMGLAGDPWSSISSKNNQVKPNTASVSVTASNTNNNPWSDALVAPIATNSNTNKTSLSSLNNNDPWATKSVPQANNASLWPSFTTTAPAPTKQASNTAAMLTNAILNDLWSNNANNTTASTNSAIPVASNPVVNNPFLASSVFPSASITSNGGSNGVMSNYSALSHPWLLSSSITTSSSLSNSNKTSNPFID